jgi:O-Antigen ligase
MVSLAAFLSLFVAGAVMALVRHPIYGVWLYLASIYVHPPSRWWAQMLPDLRWSMLAAVIALLSLFIHRKKIQPLPQPWYRTAPGMLLLLFVIWFWAQNLWALDGPTHLDASVQFTKYLIAFYLVYRVAADATSKTDILLGHVVGCLFLGIVAFTVGRDLGDRLNGVGGPGIDDANSLGMYFATAVVVGAALLLSVRRWRVAILLVALPLILNGLILTGSRGAFLGLVAGGLVVLVLRPPQRAWMFWGAGVLGVILAVTLVDQKFVDRVLTLRGAVEHDGAIDGSAENRVVLIDAQWQMAAKYPHGAGHRGTVALSPQYLGREWLTTRPGESEDQAGRSSHNTFLTVLVEQGLPGMLIYCALFLWGALTIARLWVLRRRVPPEVSAPAVACAAAMAVVFTAGQFTDYLLAEVQIWLLALLAAGMQHLTQAAAHDARDQPMPGLKEQPLRPGHFTR